jgi:iron complex outermembrane receptor protein
MRYGVVLTALLLAPGADGAERSLPAVTVTAQTQRDAEQPAPLSRTVLDAAVIRRAGPQVDASEVLQRVPGLVANNRWNYAQDLQLALRGYGARTSFGVRGIKLYVNGVPASAPDGQGQLAHAALAAIDRIEVIRGPLAALYGNAAGGVIKLDTEPGARSGARGSAASWNDAWRAGVGWRAAGDRGALALDLSRFDTDGFRPHSAARRDTLDAVFDTRIGGGWRLAATANAIDAPESEDPLGLTPADFARDSASTAPAAFEFDTRKSVRQNQLGAALIRSEADDFQSLRLAAYGGVRRVEQYLAVPVATQANPLNGGGVVDLARDYAGIEARIAERWDIGHGTVTLTGGVNIDRLDEDRRGFENFVGSRRGVRGNLRRDEANQVENRDLLLQAEWTPIPALRALAGVRRSRVEFESKDRFITASNPDDGGARRFAATVPALGLSWSATPALDLRASIARGFETPTVAELAFRADGTAGINFALEPARSTQRELGLAWRGARAALDLALFRDDTRDEIAVARNQGGRAAFQNAGRTRREGTELALSWQPHQRVRASLAATVIDARYRGSALCVGANCPPSRPAFTDGNRLPAVPRRFAFAEVTASLARGWQLGMEARAVDAVFADDANRLRAPGYGTLAARLTRHQRLGKGTLRATLRLDNVFDRTHVSSVIVNEANGRVFEPGRGRTLSLIVDYRW